MKGKGKGKGNIRSIFGSKGLHPTILDRSRVRQRGQGSDRRRTADAARRRPLQTSRPPPPPPSSNPKSPFKTRRLPPTHLPYLFLSPPLPDRSAYNSDPRRTDSPAGWQTRGFLLLCSPPFLASLPAWSKEAGGQEPAAVRPRGSAVNPIQIQLASHPTIPPSPGQPGDPRGQGREGQIDSSFHKLIGRI